MRNLSTIRQRLNVPETMIVSPNTPASEAEYIWDVALLLRAVRQLGEAAFGAKDIDLSGVDSDVIELLDDGG